MKNKEFMMLQLFAAGDNNDMPVRSYQLEFKSLLQAVFKTNFASKFCNKQAKVLCSFCLIDL